MRHEKNFGEGRGIAAIGGGTRELEGPITAGDPKKGEITNRVGAIYYGLNTQVGYRGYLLGGGERI